MESSSSSLIGNFTLRLPLSSASAPTPADLRRIIVNVEVLREKKILVGEVLVVRSQIQKSRSEQKVRLAAKLD